MVKKEIEKNPVPILTLKEAKIITWLLGQEVWLDNDPHCKMFEEFYKPAFTYKALNKLIQGSQLT